MSDLSTTNLMYLEDFVDPFILSNILNSMSQGLILNNQSDYVIYANDSMEELLGYSSIELIGLTHEKTCALLYGRYYDRKNTINIKEDIKEGKVIVERRRLVHKHGQGVPLEIHAHPVYDQDKSFNGAVLLFKDLHDELLFAVTKLVNSSLALSEVLENTTQAVVEHLGLASNAIFLLNDEKTELTLASCNVYGSVEQMAKVVIKVGEGAPGVIAKERKPLYVSNLRTDPSIDEISRQLHADKSSIGYPLIFKDEILGVIAFDADIVRVFSEKEKILFENVANQVALAIYNAQLFTRLEYRSITDGLTGIHNHRYLQERLKDELERANRNAGSLSLLMIDVDNFKNYNDTYGHINGDAILKQISHLIRTNVRNIDIVARYGGEEFAVILVDCNRATAVDIAERIRYSIEQSNCKVTISIGIATNGKATDNKKLLSQADQALYKAKQNGRNRVEVYKKTIKVNKNV